MKKIRLFVFILFMELNSFTQNLVVNPGFETWEKTTNPSGWITAQNCLKDSVNIMSGTYSCRHAANMSTTKSLGQKLPVSQGFHYRLSFFYKTETIGNEYGCRIWCDWKDASGNNITDASAKLILQPASYMKSDTWLRFSIDIVAPVNASYFNLEVRTYQNSIAYWDDFVFEENTATFTPEEKVSGIMIYPNPAHEYLTISKTEKLQRIEIQNLAGMNVWTSDLSGETMVTIPVSGFQDGLYIVRILAAGKTITRKFIKSGN